MRNGGTPTFSASDNSLKISVLSDDSHVFAYMNPVSLAIGENLQISFNVNFTSPKALGSFAFGVFDSVGNPENLMPAHENKLGITNYTKTMSGILTTTEKLCYRPENSTDGFLSSGSGGKRVFNNYNEPLQNPESGKDFSFSLNLTKTALGFDVSVALGGNAAQNASAGTSFSVETATLSEIDVLGFRFSSATGGTTTLSDLRISTTGTIGVPEPSAFGLLAGIVGLALAVSRRRRSRNS